MLPTILALTLGPLAWCVVRMLRVQGAPSRRDGRRGLRAPGAGVPTNVRLGVQSQLPSGCSMLLPSKGLGYLALFLAAAAPRLASAACVAPTQAAQTSAQQRLEGEVKATVLQFGASAAGEREDTSTWATQLPSQAGIDNQWYLYYLCREFEGGRLPRAQYCTINAALWSRITGMTVSPDACLVETAVAATAPPPAAGPPAALPVSTVLPAAPEATSPPPAAATAQFAGATAGTSVGGTGSEPGGRWSANIPGRRAVDLYGPYRIAGTQTWYFDNLSDCLTAISQKGGKWVEEVVAGAHCSPWTEVEVGRHGTVLRVVGNGDVIEASLLEAGTHAEIAGEWRGRAYPVQDVRLREAGWKGVLGDMGLAAAERVPSMEVTVQFTDQVGTTNNVTAGCAGTLKRGSSGPGWVQYLETTTEGPCPSGAVVTAFSLSPGSLLYTWQSANGSIYDITGVVHAVE